MISFIKMHANGNDFMIIDAWHHNIEVPAADVIAQWADRQTGIGFDQLLYFTSSPDPKAVANCLIFNADGSESGQCGHGMACIAQRVHRQGYVHTMEFSISTKAGLWPVVIMDEHSVCVDLGRPIFNPEAIPMHVAEPSRLYQLAWALGGQNPQSMRVMDAQQSTLLAPFLNNEQANAVKSGLWASVLSLGNPHCVVPVASLDAVSADWGRLLSEHPQFPLQANVEFMQIIRPDLIRLRVYERGVGENRACGSGACAAVVAGRLLHYLDERVTVQFPKGDTIEVLWSHSEDTVKLTTIVQYVFKGHL